MNRPKPYIGFTGPTSLDDVQKVLEGLARTPEDPTIMVGVLMSHSTLIKGEIKAGGRSPDTSQIPSIFPSGYETLNIVHYSTRDRTALHVQMYLAMEAGGHNCDGIQLNVNWPNAEELLEFRRMRPNAKIILQFGGRHMDLADYRPLSLASRIVSTYHELIDYILLDMSGGMGRDLDPAMLTKYLAALRMVIEHYRFSVGLAIAGGLSAENVHLIAPLRQQFPGLSIDAEGKLRDSRNALDHQKARAYLEAALSQQYARS